MPARLALRCHWLSAICYLLVLASLAACRTTPTLPPPTPVPTHFGAALGGLAFIRDFNVWLADANGDNPHQLTTDGSSNQRYSFLRWSPDGTQLAFVSHDLQSGQVRLLLAALDGSITLIAEDVALLSPPAWSPSGDQLAYVADRKQPAADGRAGRALRIVDLGQRRMRDVGNFGFTEGCGGAFGDPADLLLYDEMGYGDSRPTFRRPTLLWTASGDFVFDQRCDLVDLAWMSGQDGHTVELDTRWTSAALSPDGQRLVAVVEDSSGLSPQPSPGGGGSQRTLVVANVDGSDARLVGTGDNPLAPVWSPDGTTLYYITRDFERSLDLTEAQAEDALGVAPVSLSVYRSRIRRVRLDGSGPETVLEAVAHGLTNLTFSRSGSRLLYSQVANSSDLYDAIQADIRGEALQARYPSVRVESISLTGPRSGFVLFENAGQPTFAGPSAVPVVQATLGVPTAPPVLMATETPTPAVGTYTPTPETTGSVEPTATDTVPALLVTRTPTRPVPTLTPPLAVTDWRGEYFNNRDLAGAAVLVRNDQGLDFDWGTNSPGLGIPADNFSVRWTRSLSFGAGNYRFLARADDGVRVFVDNVAIIDEWHDGDTTYSGNINLSGGSHAIRVEYFDHLGRAAVTVWWEDANSFSAWRGEYFTNRNLEGQPFMLRDDGGIDFNWGGGSPQAGIPADNFSVRWGRRVSFDGGRYRFTVVVNDGARLYVDGDLVIDQWREGSEQTFKAEKDLSDDKHDIRLDYFDRSGDARIKLSWDRISEPTATPSQTPSGATPTGQPGPTATSYSIPTPETIRPSPSFTPVALTATWTPMPPTNTPKPPTPTDTPKPPPTNTPVPPTNTPVPPTNTPVPPTNTPVPPTNTPKPEPSATPGG
jgi:hypothetical protein